MSNIIRWGSEIFKYFGYFYCGMVQKDVLFVAKHTQDDGTIKIMGSLKSYHLKLLDRVVNIDKIHHLMMTDTEVSKALLDIKFRIDEGTI